AFDLKEINRVSDVYRLVHEVGGYKYVKMDNGKWGCLPGTCIVYRSDASTESRVLGEFVDLISGKLGVRVRNVCVLRGSPTAMALMVDSPEWLNEDFVIQQKPATVFGYAKNRVLSPT
ncbi:MAG: hypothetical protein AAF664_12085, partial [Planctomycetota bacterium]